ncbi:hypothetical protein [Nocardiopsis sp. MG754419]|uniref:hypothetical protein n=1 Tax=Nocardiopsis sp. MG754419 TaxID=2259865 RepID=UPI001BABC107|nr:hypothetical protein [Nocardiopsis sp. MG754419]MBR8743317.1 hypothetical protein [Nocardiopsis sp. MG754419]
MVLASREWLVSTSRAARNARGACARLLLLSGIVAVAWIAGGIGVAHSDTGAESGGLVDSVLGVGESAERTGQAATEEIRQGRVTETANRAAASTEAVADTAVTQASSLPASALEDSGVSATLRETTIGSVADTAVNDTAQVVDETTRGASGLVDGVARTGKDVVKATDESLREGTLVDGVTEGLAESVGHTGIDSVTESGGPLGLPLLGGTEDPATSSVRGSDADEREDEDEESGRGRPHVDHGVPAHVTETGLRVAAEAARTVAGQTAQESDDAERIRLIAGGSHHQPGPDATGASAPSFPAPGAAGFLMNRSGHMVLRAQRVALPGDPTLVVRDAADDPSFSPD